MLCDRQDLASEPDRGATLRAIPATHCEHHGPDRAGAHAVGPLGRGQSRSAVRTLRATPPALRVLLVEDDPTSREVALLLLGHLGYRADVAGNGAEALAAVDAAPYDVVLMDVQLPEMDGIEATRRIRSELPAGRQPVIIAVSATTTDEDQRARLQSGMDDNLAKPIRIEALAAALDTRVPRHWTTHDLEPQDPGDRSPSTREQTANASATPVRQTEGPAVYDPAPLNALVTALGADAQTIRAKTSSRRTSRMARMPWRPSPRPAVMPTAKRWRSPPMR